jgi:GrpB-like predicted nucleotidyltransferase (UPF0157 family)
MSKDRPYKLEEYNPNWKELFQEEKNKIEGIFSDILVDIQHIGSTSLEGMFAKPQIDIMVIVSDLERVKALYQQMTYIEYVARGDYSNIGEEYFTKDNKQSYRVVSVHVFQEGNKQIDAILGLRDYLRKNHEAKERYTKIKKDLYTKYPEDYISYNSEKGDLIQELIEESKEN